MLTDTTAIVLKAIPFSETSAIVTMLTDKHGKMALMARGARRNKSPYAGLLEPGSCLDVSYYFKQSREVQNLKEAVQSNPTWKIHQKMEKMAIAMASLELVEQLCHSYEPMQEVLDFLRSMLDWLHQTDMNPGNLFPYIQFRLAQLTGIAISGDESLLHTAQKEPNVFSGCFLNVETGSVSMTPDTGFHLRMSITQMKYILNIFQNNRIAILTESYPTEEIKKLIHHFDTYFQYHVEGIRPRKSDAIFDQIM